MTQEEIIRMAREAGLEQVVAINPKDGGIITKSLPPELLKRFAAMVAAHERENSAKMQADCTLAEPKCNPHPDAPHGFNRNASHNADRYVCDCEGWEPEEPVKRPQNCGTGYCSCIECVMEPVSIPDHITCPFCESDHVPDWLHDLKVDAAAIRARGEK